MCSSNKTGSSPAETAAVHTDKRSSGVKESSGAVKSSVTENSGAVLYPARQLIREYSSLKEQCTYVEKHRKGFLKRMGIVRDPVFSELLSYRELLKLNLADCDKQMLSDYIDAKEKTMLLEEGVERMGNAKYRAYMTDHLLKGCSYQEVMEKNGVSYRTVKRAKHEAVTTVMDLLGEYQAWKGTQVTISSRTGET